MKKNPEDCLKPGRKAVWTDEDVVELIELGCDTPDHLLAALEMKSKSGLMTRLRRLRAEGRVTIVERKRCDGFSILPRR